MKYFSISLNFSGNIAHGHILTIKKLLSKNNEHITKQIDGLPIYLSDDSPGILPSENLAEFLEPLGIPVEKSSDQYMLTMNIKLRFLQILSHIVQKLKYKKIGDYMAKWKEWMHIQKLVFMTCIVNYTRAKLCLGYSPKYDYLYAKKTSLLYYKKMTKVN